jgi:hypothetical protein
LRARRKSAGLADVTLVVPTRWHRKLQAMAQYLRDHPHMDAVEFIPYYRDAAGRIHPMAGGL